MNSADARKILIACRPGTDDLRTPEAMEALELVRHDPELLRWWEQQRAWHRGMQESFRAIPVPVGLHDHILARAKVIEIPWWRRPSAWRAAAAIVLLGAVAVLWWKPSHENSFPTFRSRMVGNVLRQYTMGIVTNDMAQIRTYLATNQAPSDYILPPGLERLPALGAGVLGWQDRRASMVCLDSRSQGTLFLFIVDGTSMKGPPARPEFAAVKELRTVSWSAGGKTYVLAGTGSQDWLQSFF